MEHRIGAQIEVVDTAHRELRCQLDERELLAKGAALADAEEREQAMLEEHRERKKDMAAAEKSVRREIGDLAYDVRDRSERRTVECLWQVDFARDIAELVRDDTGEVLEARPITERERQRSLC